MIPLIAIVGRPNVGKSTLFNRLVGGLRAIVEDEAGVTRDRHYGTVSLLGREVHMVDTGGFEPTAEGQMESLIRRQTQLAIEEADLVMIIFDARDGLLDSDRDVTEALRRSGKAVLHVANKADGPKQEAACGDFYSLGLPQLHTVSALHGLGVEDLKDAMVAALPEEDEPPAPDSDPDSEPGEEEEVRVTLLGRPNAGKSSLLNHLAGEERSIVSDTPGTTRDPVDARIDTPSGPVVIVDTAGIRKKRTIAQTMESYAIIRALRSIADADVTCLIMDATAGVVDQDCKIANLALDSGKGLILVFTKCDLITRQDREELKQQAADKLRFVTYAPLMFISSVSGRGVKGLLSKVRRVRKECGRRVATSDLNRFLELLVAEHPPPNHRGRAIRLYYITQPGTHPPTFVVSTNAPEGIGTSYRRYVVNRLRKKYGFVGVPLRSRFRKHGGRKPKIGKGKGRGHGPHGKKGRGVSRGTRRTNTRRGCCCCCCCCCGSSGTVGSGLMSPFLGVI